jgi:hypothetical protein
MPIAQIDFIDVALAIVFDPRNSDSRDEKSISA